MPLHELSELVDDGNRVEIALALRLSPCKQPVASQHHAIAANCLFHYSLQHHTQLEARTLPG